MTDGVTDGVAGGVAEVLEAKRADLRQELARLSAPASEAGGISFGKRVGDGTSMAVERLSQVAAHDRLRAMVSEVERAQAKLAEGTYGVCDRCGAVVPAERLEALPWAVLCVTCPR
ncbi:MAG: TraR/DksA family transcriptional regulator [Actinomycetes bacterium]